MQEIWKPKSSIRIKNYKAHTQIRNPQISSKSNGGGIGHYAHKSHKINMIKEDLNLRDSVEMYAFCIHNYVIINCYRPPNGSLSNAFFNHIENKINHISHNNKHIILIGDLNIDILLKNSYWTKLKNLMDSLGMEQLVTKPSRISKSKNSLIDHCWTTDLDLVATTEDLDISDHFAILIDLQKCTIPIKKIKIRLKNDDTLELLSNNLEESTNFLMTCDFPLFISHVSKKALEDCPYVQYILIKTEKIQEVRTR